MVDSDLGGSPEFMKQKFEPVVAILDGGGQYIDLIKKACERLGYPAELLPYDTSLEEIEKRGFQAVVGSGSGSSVYDDGSPRLDPAFRDSELPQFHVCYSMQELLNSDGNVGSRSYRNDGRMETQLDDSHPIFEKINPKLNALFTHGDFIDDVPEGYEIIGSHQGKDGQQVISAVAKNKTVGVQFHPEAFEETDQGYDIFRNFLKNVAEIEPNEEFLHNHMDRWVLEKEQEIIERVGSKQVVSLISGGVDSVVSTALVNRVIPKDQMHLVYVDNGYMRDVDTKDIQKLIDLGWNITVIDAADKFDEMTMEFQREQIGPLSETAFPPHKRVLSGTAFMEVVDEYLEAQGIGLDDFVLVQGTNAADRIESGQSKSNDSNTEEIKLHHNMVEAARNKDPLEPLDDLFKDEVRAVGVHLGIPDTIAYRQPFPGPGNLIRILDMDEADVEEHSAENVAEAERFIGEANEHLPSPLDVKLLPIRSIGVGGDHRSYISAMAIDGDISSKDLAGVAKEATSSLKGIINRVVHKLGGHSLESLTPTTTRRTKEVRVLKQRVDTICEEEMHNYGVYADIEQMPIVLLGMGTEDKRSIVLRPVSTETFLTVDAMLPDTHLPRDFYETVTIRILSEVPEISHVFLDATKKPPATTEWE